MNISDIIEEFILSNMGDDEFINLSRNELAQFFKCAPSQINYVLATRFNLNRGFITESQRGGGGYIKLTRAKYDDEVMEIILQRLGDSIGYKDACFLLGELSDKEYITEEQEETLTLVISPKALSCPLKIEDSIRSNILKNSLSGIIKERVDE